METKLFIADRKLQEPYAALSYAWGKSPNLRLTASTLVQFSHSISHKKMPKSVQDAVATTRRLGIRYLWVDALCIIQDSVSDWNREAAVMGDIYADAIVVLKAASSADCQDGLYPRREKDEVADFKLQMVLEDGSSGFASVRLKSLNVSEALDTRGWCLQEPWLARRMLVFGSRQMWWECGTCTPTESGSPILKSNLGSTRSQKSIASAHNNDSNQDSSAETKADDYKWEDVVGALSARTFTFADDSLSALSGIAKLLSNIDRVGDTYIAGLWKSDLPKDLLWNLWAHHNEISETDRPAKLHSPSWSWASVSGGTIRWPGGDERALEPVCASVVLYLVTPRGDDYFGKTESKGSMMLKTQLKTAWRFLPEYRNMLAGWLLTAEEPVTPRPAIDLITNFQAMYDGTIGMCKLDWRDAGEDCKQAHMLYCARITKQRGLILERVSENGATFRRRGAIESWEDVAEDYWTDCGQTMVTIV